MNIRKVNNNTTSTNVKYIPHAKDIAGVEEIYKSLSWMSGFPQKPEVIFMYDTPEIIELREISRVQAKREILQLIQKSDQIYYSEISDKLRLDIELVVEICHELEKEGLVQGVNK